MKSEILGLLAVGMLAGAMTANAALITSAPVGGTTTVLTTVTGTFASAPSVVAGGFTVSAPSGDNVWYGDSSFGLANNGSWSNFAWVGGSCFSGSCTATINLGGAYSAAGGFMNYATDNGSVIIAAIAADGITVLESFDLTSVAAISTPGGLNAGAFRGISRNTADIAYLQLSGGYSILHDLTIARASVPEPGTLALLGLGLAGLGLSRRRKA